mgnify:CR=1 FL=1
MNDVKEILQVICRNEEVARKFFEIETSILSIHNFRDLFEKLLTEIHDKFSVPRVWIAMTEDNDVWRLLDRMTTGGTFGERLRIVDAQAFGEIVTNGSSPVLANEGMERFASLLPEDARYTLGSIAVVPLTYEGTAIGSLNLGDESPERYGPGMEVSLLRQLAVQLSGQQEWQQALLLFEKPPRIFILRMRYVPLIDAAGLHALEVLHERLGQNGTCLILSGVNPQVRRFIEKSMIDTRIGSENIVHPLDKIIESIAEFLIENACISRAGRFDMRVRDKTYPQLLRSTLFDRSREK